MALGGTRYTSKMENGHIGLGQATSVYRGAGHGEAEEPWQPKAEGTVSKRTDQGR
jgi:hypothetical protein